MKSLLIALLFSSSVYAHCQREVQFIGTVKNVTYVENDAGQIESTRFQVKAGRWFQPSGVCPMEMDEFEAAVVELRGEVALHAGGEISGVMVFDVNNNSYRIE
jgi:hypothetical protein